MAEASIHADVITPGTEILQGSAHSRPPPPPQRNVPCYTTCSTNHNKMACGKIGLWVKMGHVGKAGDCRQGCMGICANNATVFLSQRSHPPLQQNQLHTSTESVSHQRQHCAHHKCTCLTSHTTTYCFLGNTRPINGQPIPRQLMTPHTTTCCCTATRIHQSFPSTALRAPATGAAVRLLARSAKTESLNKDPKLHTSVCFP